MSDKQQMSQSPSVCEKSRCSGHENRLINSVVRNVVVNMECVLSDLQGIMGEITTIVEHIDNVTHKMEKNGRIKKESTVQKSHNSDLRKYQWETRSKYTTDIENNFYNTKMDSEKTLAQHYQPQHDNSIHNILKVNGFSRAQTLSLSDDQQLQPPVKGKAFPFSKNSQSDPFSSFFPKSFSNLPKDGNRSSSQVGVIAIVHPTVINNTAVQSITSGKEASQRGMFDDSLKSLFKEERSEDSTWQKSNNDNVPSNQTPDLLPQTCPPKSDHVQGTQKRTQQTGGEIQIVSKCVQSVMSPKRQTNIGGKNTGFSHSDFSIGRNDDYCTGDESNGHSTNDCQAEINATVLESPTDFQSLTESRAMFKALKPKESVFETSMDHSQNKRLILDKESNNMTNSFILKHSSLKYVYSSVQMPPRNKESEDSSLQPESQNCYDSTDSDINVEIPDNRCATPAIDYSYLNLVGNNAVLDDSLESIPLNGSHQLHNMHVDCAHTNEHGHQEETDPEVTASELSTPSLSSVDISLFESPTRLSQDVLKSPVWTHAYCSEVTAGEPGEYCGCYEQVLDSVLENLAGFESLQEACEDFDCTAALNKSYVMFENEYEEDDWGLGLKLAEQHEYQPSSVQIRDVGGQGCASLEIVDSNMNLLANNSQGNKLNVLAHSRTGYVATESRKECRNIVEQRQDKGILSTVETMSRIKESPRKASKLGELISSEKQGVTQPATSNSQQTFNVQLNQTCNLQKNQTFNIRANQIINIQPNQTLNARPNSFKSNGPTLWKGKMSHADQTNSTLHISAATGYPLGGMESPMSLCSLEALSETVSLSESDSWLASSDDSRSVSSESRFKPSTSVHKARMKQLRRDFFKSMYTATEVEREVVKEIGLVSNQSICMDNNWCMTDSSRETLSESGSYQEALTGYNRNINPWTAYALEHTDDMSDSSSDIFNTTSCSITTSPDGDNNDSALEAQV